MLHHRDSGQIKKYLAWARVEHLLETRVDHIIARVEHSKTVLYGLINKQMMILSF